MEAEDRILNFIETLKKRGSEIIERDKELLKELAKH